MRIEEGKFYRTRDGRKVGPAKVSEWPAKGLPWSLGCEMLYSDKGVYGNNFDTSMDLISEWAESPIVTKTVTVRRLEPGVYGRLKVAEGSTRSKTAVGVVGPRMDDSVSCWSLSAAELRELARAALEIAEYLDGLD